MAASDEGRTSTVGRSGSILSDARPQWDDQAADVGKDGQADGDAADAEGTDAALMLGLSAMLGGYGSESDEEGEGAQSAEARPVEACDDVSKQGAVAPAQAACDDVSQQAEVALVQPVGEEACDDVTNEAEAAPMQLATEGEAVLIAEGDASEDAGAVCFTDVYAEYDKDEDDWDKDDEVERNEESEKGSSNLQSGATVCIAGLSSEAGKALNGQHGLLGEFDPETGRWRVSLDNGDAKAVKRENLIVVRPPPEEDAEVVEEDAPADQDFSTWDSNELSAAILQAELDEDEPMVAKLQAVLDARPEGGVTGVGSIPNMPGASDVEEYFEVPADAVGLIIGRGGENIRAISAQCGGVKLQIQPVDALRNGMRNCSARGSPLDVAKAMRLVRQTVAQATAGKAHGKGKGKDWVGGGAGGTAGFAQGICKWYAAGFCRNRPQDGCCRNGLHNAEAAHKAEAEWVSLGQASAGPANAPCLPLLLLLDLEGGGNKDGRDGEDEIIEVPILAMCPATGRELGRFHRFSRPGYWDREARSMRQRYPPACFNPRSKAVPFPKVVLDMHQWIRGLLQLPPQEELKSHTFLFVTCGNWDVKSAIPRQCNNPVAGTVDFGTQRLLFSRWSNLKEVFRDHYHLTQATAPTGMRGMLNRLRIPLAGQHHLGMDDVSNLAKIMKHLISDGCLIGPTGSANLGAGATAGRGGAGGGAGGYSPCGFPGGKGFGKGKGGFPGRFPPPPPMCGPPGGLQNFGGVVGPQPHFSGQAPFPAPGQDLGRFSALPQPQLLRPSTVGPRPSPGPLGIPTPQRAPAPHQASGAGIQEEVAPAQLSAAAQKAMEFLANAPLPGEFWQRMAGEEEGEEEEPEEDAEDASKAAEAEVEQPAKKPRLSSFLASLPPPRNTSAATLGSGEED